MTNWIAWWNEFFSSNNSMSRVLYETVPMMRTKVTSAKHTEAALATVRVAARISWRMTKMIRLKMMKTMTRSRNPVMMTTTITTRTTNHQTTSTSAAKLKYTLHGSLEQSVPLASC